MAIGIHSLENHPIKKLHIFYILDTSGSMSGDPIGALNDAMRSTVEELRKKDGEKADLRIAVLEYNSENRWVTQGNNGVENLQDFFWTDLQATGMTYLGGALKELNTVLSQLEKMKDDTGNKIPIIIFMSDGCPIAIDDWQADLQVLSENKWYRAAIKIAFALGDYADTDVLANVVGVTEWEQIIPNYGAVIKTNDLQVFSNMIQNVSVSAVEAVSSSQMLETKVSAEMIVKEVAGVHGVPDENGVVIIDAPSTGGINTSDVIFDDLGGFLL